jgi:hypothetical protein
MANGKRYNKRGGVTENVKVTVSRIGDHIYLTVGGEGVEIPVADWIHLTAPKAPPVGFGPVQRDWKINDLGTVSVSAVGE